MGLQRLDLDARRIETRATELIQQVGLEDEYGESGGLIATFLPEEQEIVVQDEAFSAHFPVDDGYITQQTWDQIHCYILGCTDHGCPENHQHYEVP